MNLNELAYVFQHFEFSSECTEAEKNLLLGSGYVREIEGVYVVSDAGELKLGVNIDEETDTIEDDITQVFMVED